MGCISGAESSEIPTPDHECMCIHTIIHLACMSQAHSTSYTVNNHYSNMNGKSYMQ